MNLALICTTKHPLLDRSTHFGLWKPWYFRKICKWQSECEGLVESKSRNPKNVILSGRIFFYSASPNSKERKSKSKSSYLYRLTYWLLALYCYAAFTFFSAQASKLNITATFKHLCSRDYKSLFALCTQISLKRWVAQWVNDDASPSYCFT